MDQSRLRVGVLGASRIVGKALCNVADGLIEVTAIAARDLLRAETFARQYGIPSAYGSYQKLIDDPEIDAVYVALPCSEHVPWTLAALRAGKHVLCEKPFALDLEEARSAVALANDVGKVLMEAHHWRYHPLVAEAEVAFRDLGLVESIQAEFNGALNNPGDIRTNPLLGPGVIMDFGCYLIQWVSWAAAACGVKESLAVKSARMTIDPEIAGVDMAADVELRWGEVRGGFSCDMRDGTPFRSSVRVVGSQRSIHFENPLFTEGSSLRITTHGQQPRTEVVDCAPGTTTYRQQLLAFCAAVNTGQNPLTSGENILQTQFQLDEVYRAAGVISRRELRLQAQRGEGNSYDAR